MAELVSPGVSVEIQDESFYAPAGTGTVPLIVVATSQDKTTPDGTSIAEGTTAAEAGKVQLVTSQRDLLYRYGSPSFATDGAGSALISEVNEYGLFAAYSFLGIANRAYILRADVNLADLAPSATEPTQGPAEGSYWVDTDDTVWGLKRWSGTEWVRQSVYVIQTGDLTAGNQILDSTPGLYAVKFIDWDGATATPSAVIEFYQKVNAGSGGEWNRIGSTTWVANTGGNDFQLANHTNLPTTREADGLALTEGDLVLQMNSFNLGTIIDLLKYESGAWNSQTIFGSNYSYKAHANYISGGLQSGEIWADYNNGESGVVLKTWSGVDTTTAQGIIVADDAVNITTHNAQLSTDVNSTGGANAVLSAVVGGVGVSSFIDSITIVDGGDGYAPGNVVVVTHADGHGSGFAATVDTVDGNGSITAISITDNGEGYYAASLQIIVNNANIIDNNGDLGRIFIPFYGYDDGVGGNISVDGMVRAIQDGIAAADDSLTFADDLTVTNVNNRITITSRSGYDIFVDGRDVDAFNQTAVGFTQQTFSNWIPITYEPSTTAPTGNLSDGTLWYDNLIATTRLDILYNNVGTWESYAGDVQVAGSTPSLNSVGSALQSGDIWVDSSDLESYPKIYKWSGTAWSQIDTADQITSDGIVFGDFRSNFSSLDNDVADNGLDASLYPYGILAWNKRLSGGNVKRWDATNERWDDASGNKPNGSPYMLRKAQRQIIVAGLQAALNSNTNIRNENNRFNLIAAPGYTECLDEMLALSQDRKNTAFVIGDTPLRLESDAQSISDWVNNVSGAGNNDDDGLVSGSEYAAIYYPHGRTSNLEGQDVVVPSSHMALRTFAFNDQVAFPWFAPAGFQRGVVTNASSLGYIDPATSEFVTVSLNEGQRDTLYSNRVNPISQFPGRGIAVFGQKTLKGDATALDRINVARLVVYLRERLDDIVKPFLFEPNDEITRQNAKVVVDRFLGNLVSQRGLFDFVTVCDTTNNTPARIDRNELYIDIAVQPVKAVEFIYIPVRIQNTLGSTN